MSETKHTPPSARQIDHAIQPRVSDDDAGQITVTLDGLYLRGWSYVDDAERRQKMLQAREYVEGWCDARDHSAMLVEAMIAAHRLASERMALAIAARDVRRGRRLTPNEQLENIASAMDEADRDHGDNGFAETAARIRNIAREKRP